MALSDKAANDKLVLVEKLEAKDGKTRNAVAMLAKLPVKGRLALVNTSKDDAYARSVRNLKTVRLFGAGNISLVDVIRAEYLVLTTDAAEKFEKVYGKKA